MLSKFAFQMGKLVALRDGSSSPTMSMPPKAGGAGHLRTAHSVINLRSVGLCIFRDVTRRLTAFLIFPTARQKTFKELQVEFS
jgi:hypothetical protein